MATSLGPTSFGTPSGETGSMDKAIAEFWVKTALETRAPNFVFDEILNRGGPNCWKRIPVREGETLNWWRMPLGAAKTTALAETAVDAAGEAVSAAQVSAKVAQYGNYVMVSDRLDSVMLMDPRDAFGLYLMNQCMRTNDALIRLAAHAGGTARYRDSVTAAAITDVSATNVLSRAFLSHVALYFKNNYVPPCENGWYLYLAHPQTVKDLRADTSNAGWLDVTKYDLSSETRTEIKQAFVGRCEAFEILETPEISSADDGGGSATVYRNIAAGYQSIGGVSLAGNATPGAPQKGTGAPKGMPQRQLAVTKSNLGIIYKGYDSGGVANPLERRASIAWKFDQVYKVLEAERVVIHYVGSDT